ncbi:hypothetical protein GGTG_02889 [Gaeumannomyces tritici R3-111a-1]|uniref:Uncharacterized protein n=1 Tax=Gaeumannomyces tritici (strain R3-111a-1) TaxID=644352 RepID=J3NNN2_GAET3|nr:hypothetical protein GGTG_02889 [Gaeumannomyces tritici R3-111a-1]EJT77784.1 hypothetical protein GGTG_02889 [Gaeumannomyces tritici R3-111a-1]
MRPSLREVRQEPVEQPSTASDAAESEPAADNGLGGPSMGSRPTNRKQDKPGQDTATLSLPTPQAQTRETPAHMLGAQRQAWQAPGVDNDSCPAMWLRARNSGLSSRPHPRPGDGEKSSQKRERCDAMIVGSTKQGVVDLGFPAWGQRCANHEHSCAHHPHDSSGPPPLLPWR